MPHLLMAKYTAPVRAQRHAKTAIPRFIVSIPITFDSRDGVETRNRRGPPRQAKIKFKKVIAPRCTKRRQTRTHPAHRSAVMANHEANALEIAGMTAGFWSKQDLLIAALRN